MAPSSTGGFAVVAAVSVSVPDAGGSFAPVSGSRCPGASCVPGTPLPISTAAIAFSADVEDSAGTLLPPSIPIASVGAPPASAAGLVCAPGATARVPGTFSAFTFAGFSAPCPTSGISTPSLGSATARPSFLPSNPSPLNSRVEPVAVASGTGESEFPWNLSPSSGTGGVPVCIRTPELVSAGGCFGCASASAVALSPPPGICSRTSRPNRPLPASAVAVHVKLAVPGMAA